MARRRSRVSRRRSRSGAELVWQTVTDGFAMQQGASTVSAVVADPSLVLPDERVERQRQATLMRLLMQMRFSAYGVSTSGNDGPFTDQGVVHAYIASFRGDETYEAAASSASEEVIWQGHGAITGTYTRNGSQGVLSMLEHSLDFDFDTKVRRKLSALDNVSLVYNWDIDLFASTSPDVGLEGQVTYLVRSLWLVRA